MRAAAQHPAHMHAVAHPVPSQHACCHRPRWTGTYQPTVPSGMVKGLTVEAVEAVMDK